MRVYLSGTAKTDPFLLWVAFGHSILSQEQESHTSFPHSDQASLGRDEDQAGEQRWGLAHFGKEVRHKESEIDSHTFKLSFQAVMNGSCGDRGGEKIILNRLGIFLRF